MQITMVRVQKTNNDWTSAQITKEFKITVALTLFTPGQTKINVYWILLTPIKFSQWTFFKIRLIKHESRLCLPKPRFQYNFDWLCFDSIYSWEKEIKELSLSHLFLFPESTSYQNWKRGFGKYKRLSPCTYQINSILGKVYSIDSHPHLMRKD